MYCLEKKRSLIKRQTSKKFFDLKKRYPNGMLKTVDVAREINVKTVRLSVLRMNRQFNFEPCAIIGAQKFYTLDRKLAKWICKRINKAKPWHRKAVRYED